MHRFATVLLALAGLAVARPLAGQALEDYDYENLAFRGIGIDIGWIVPPRVDNTLGLGIRVDLGYLGPHVRIRPGIAYWASQMRQQEVDRLADQIQNVCLRQRGLISECPRLDLGRIRMSDLMINADAQYEWTDAPLLAIPFVGLGAGVHLLNGRGEAIDDTFIEDFLDSISPSINLFGGARLPVTSGIELSGEARYVLSSDIRHASFSVGAVWLLPTRASGPAGTVPARP